MKNRTLQINLFFACLWLVFLCLSRAAVAQSPATNQQSPATQTVTSDTASQRAMTGQLPYSCPACDLRGVNFSGQNLTNVNLAGANLSRANFSKAILDGAILIGANLTDADLDGARLNVSDRGPASLALANLNGASIKQAQINGADLQFASISGADFSNTDLTKAILGPRLKTGVHNGRKTSFQNSVLPRGLRLDERTADLRGVKQTAGNPAQPRAGALPVACGAANLSPLTSQIYVSPDGADNDTCGSSLTSPCKTIAKGVSRCAATGCGVLVMWAEYQLTETLQLRNSVNVYGGCLPTSQSSAGLSSVINAPSGG